MKKYVKMAISTVSCVILLFSFCTLANSEELCWDYYLVVNFKEIKIYLLDVNKTEITNYRVALPKPGKAPLKFPAEGQIKQIVFNPHWYPTSETKDFYLRVKRIKLPDAVPPDDPLNAMGKVKFVVELFEKNVYKKDINGVIRIHGTNEPHKIGQRASGGCIRMLNQEILEMARILRGAKKIKVIFTNEQSKTAAQPLFLIFSHHQSPNRFRAIFFKLLGALIQG